MHQVTLLPLGFLIFLHLLYLRGRSHLALADIKGTASCSSVNFVLYCIVSQQTQNFPIFLLVLVSACHVPASVLFDMMLNFNPSMHV